MTKQVFKGETLTRTKVKNNILRIWYMTSEEDRHDWYQEAYDFAESLARTMGAYNYQHKLKNVSKVCGVIAALSPMKRWENNKVIAEDLINTGTCGHTKTFVKKAQDVLASDGSDEAILDILNGNKISAFYLNIRYPDEAKVMTIDRHALSIALGRWVTDNQEMSMTKGQYEFFVQCYIMAAMQVGVSPLLMQSATWTKWRTIKQEY